MNKKCTSLKPETCRFHGTRENLQSTLTKANKDFTDALNAFSASEPKSSAVIVEKARHRQHTAQACFDAHDKEYTKLIGSINSYDEKYPHEAVNEKLGSWERRILVNRKREADKIRAKVGKPSISTKAQANINPVQARYEEANANYLSIQKELDKYNANHPDDMVKALEAIATKQPVPQSPKRKALAKKFDAAYKEQTAARAAYDMQRNSGKILDRNDPAFLKTLERKGYNRY